MNITINVNAPELVNAIEKLVLLMQSSVPAPSPVTSQIQQAPPTNVMHTPIIQPPTTDQPVPAAQRPTTAQSVSAVQQPIMPPAAVYPVQPVPTVAQTYTQDQLATAAVQLMDAGKQTELLNLLNNQFGVPALTQLPTEQYEAFAVALRQLGARI